MSQEIKQREHATWTEVAPGWKKHDAGLTAAYGAVTQRMLQGARVGAGGRVLDVACGAGEPSLTAAEQVGPAGHVLATDFVEEMLEAAREKAARRRLSNIEFRRVDGEGIELDPGSFDSALMKWGLMYMPDPIGCLRRMHAALRSGGRIAVACWSAPSENPWAALVVGAIKKHLEVPPPAPGAPHLFAFADKGRLQTALTEAGFVDIEIEAVPANAPPASSGAAHFAWVRDLAGPVTRLAARLTPDQIAAVQAELDVSLETYRTPNGISVPGQSWVASGRK